MSLQYINFEPGATSQLRNSLIVSILFFIYFMFISYEYLYKLKFYNLDECLATTKKGRQILILNQLFIIIALDIFLVIFVLIYNLYAYFNLSVNSTNYLIHLISNIAFEMFCIPILGILIGICAALVFKRLHAYLFMTFFALLTSPIFEGIAFTIFQTTGKNIYPIFEFFNFYSPSLNWVDNYSFGFSLLPYRLELLFMWMGIFASILLYKMSQNRKFVLKMLAGFFLMSSILNLILYIQPSSRLIMSNNPSACLTNDYLYYNDVNQIEQPAGFEIIKYEMNIDIKNSLYAKAQLSVDKNDLPNYIFTLHHGYKVKTITDQNGTALRYTCSGDYINVENNGLNRLDKIIITYKGFNAKFYSNEQGICLPGYFPFYPHSGYKKIYDITEQGFEKTLLPKPVEFIVNINYNKPVYSNLNQRPDGSFSGKTDGMTLISGFLQTITVNDIEIIYPYLIHTEYKKNNITNYINIFLNSKKDSRIINKIIILPNLNLSEYEETTIYNNYLTTSQLFNLSNKYELQTINREKRPLYLCINTYKNNKDIFNHTVEWEQGLPEDITNNRYFMTVSQMIDLLGEEAFMEKANEYIANDNDVRSISEFLNESIK